MVQQLSVLFQIIEKAGTIPWDNIKLPADRTLLAAKKMINNEREKVTAMNNAGGAKADGESPEKKPKQARKSSKKGTTPVESASAEDGGEEKVKAELADNEGFD
ncbi:hypothetical protein LTR91_000990 [Friedmanniomyces endolithicus]|uniref:Uncharacterized protein n=1 Tax=Friedmanniomyces endolithicus TaxID=329885 RepID=A0AAN6L3M9_9PEZI|nr:hypothetical protein LTS09_009815 [Friedmanniomyces endolithicus]KAK0271099.1 hypothetical protein LTR35_013660 [Friedmanniomyces endolithicus]KAK0277634.1 hypothetical protein LTS00_014125 [Friedmanniomyces endolithicus]KAK0307463.1 hypothetical protein LTR01_005463 [Friedmanniomyces endolithicus]KAK0823997.1 hypothetical protein LTR73_008033 [Friedmanniomyces endolithicus]